MQIYLSFEDYEKPIKLTTKGRDLIAYKFSRESFDNKRQVSTISEIHNYGIYLQIGINKNGKEIYYIGQGNDLYKRIKDKHGINDWKECFIFTSMNPQGLDDTDINYIEEQLINIGKKCNKDLIINKNGGRTSNPSQTVISQLDECVELIRIYCYTLRCKAFILSGAKIEKKRKDKVKFYCFRRKSNATAHYNTNGKFVVEKGSQISDMPPLPKTSKAYPSIYKDREKYKDYIDDNYKLTKDIEFNTPSGASQFVVNYSSNGFNDWKDLNNKSLGEYK